MCYYSKHGRDKLVKDRNYNNYYYYRYSLKILYFLFEKRARLVLLIEIRKSMCLYLIGTHNSKYDFRRC